jgi:hypothetical protein
MASIKNTKQQEQKITQTPKLIANAVEDVEKELLYTVGGNVC